MRDSRIFDWLDRYQAQARKTRRTRLALWLVETSPKARSVRSQRSEANRTSGEPQTSCCVANCPTCKPLPVDRQTRWRAVWFALISRPDNGITPGMRRAIRDELTGPEWRGVTAGNVPTNGGCDA